jgi:hypothetical protein
MVNRADIEAILNQIDLAGKYRCRNYYYLTVASKTFLKFRNSVLYMLERKLFCDTRFKPIAFCWYCLVHFL